MLLTVMQGIGMVVPAITAAYCLLAVIAGIARRASGARPDPK
jgi:hypothetical protein